MGDKSKTSQMQTAWTSSRKPATTLASSGVGHSGEPREGEPNERRRVAVKTLISLVMINVIALLVIFLSGTVDDGHHRATKSNDEGPAPPGSYVGGSKTVVQPTTSRSSFGPSSPGVTKSVTRHSSGSITTTTTATTTMTTTTTTTRTTTTTTSTTTRTTTTTTSTTTTNTRAPIKELVCTIGAYATRRIAYPMDGLCHYLFYYKLFIDKIGVVHGVSDDWSWDLYKERMKAYNSTKGGMAFDINYVDVSPLQLLTGDINDHAQKGHNVANYGVLDIVAKGPDLESLVVRAKLFLAELKKLQRIGEERKLFIGMGLYAFKEQNGLATFKTIFRKVVNDSTFYTVFVMTSTNQLPARGSCTVQLTGTRSRLSNLYPAFEHFKELLTNDTQYEKKLAIVGVSLQMGAFVYTLKKDFTGKPSTNIIDKDCDGAILTSPDTICKSNLTADSAYGRFGLVSRTDKKRVFAVEGIQSVKAKALIFHEWKNPNIISRFSWLVFNIQFDTSRGACDISSNYSRVRNLKKEFGIP